MQARSAGRLMIQQNKLAAFEARLQVGAHGPDVVNVEWVSQHSLRVPASEVRKEQESNLYA